MQTYAAGSRHGLPSLTRRGWGRSACRTLMIFTTITVLCALPAACQTKPAQKPAPRQASWQAVQYARRVNLIRNDLNTELTGLLRDWDRLKTARKPKSSRTPHADETPAAEVEKSLTEAIAKVRHHARRLRGLSPVPRSLLKVDDKLVDTGLQLEQALDALALWVNSGVDEWESQADKQWHKAGTTLEAALKELARRTEPGIVAKGYCDG